MNQPKSKTFQDHFKEVIEEGAPLIGYPSTTGGATWSPSSNKSTYAYNKGAEWIAQAEDDAGKAPKRIPFPLETVNERLADAFASLESVATQLSQAISINPVLSELQKDFLEQQLQAVKKMGLSIQEMMANVERVTLDY